MHSLVSTGTVPAGPACWPVIADMARFVTGPANRGLPSLSDGGPVRLRIPAVQARCWSQPADPGLQVAADRSITRPSPVSVCEPAGTAHRLTRASRRHFLRHGRTCPLDRPLVQRITASLRLETLG